MADRHSLKLFVAALPYWLAAVATGHWFGRFTFTQAMSDLRVDFTIPCDRCGQLWPASLIDSKDDGSGDFTICHCPPCYGRNWSPL